MNDAGEHIRNHLIGFLTGHATSATDVNARGAAAATRELGAPVAGWSTIGITERIR